MNKFHLPNKTIFHGVSGNPNGYSYEQARSLTSQKSKIDHLRLRLESYYISGLNNVNHPFLASILTCVGVEVLGQVMLGTDSNGESIQQNTIEIYKFLDPILSDPLTQKFKDEYNQRRAYPLIPTNNQFTSSFTCYAFVLRKGLRNSFTHNYRSMGVKLQHDLKVTVKVNERTGMLIVNPTLYRNAFKDLFNTMFDDIQNGNNQTNLQNALDYFDIIIA